MTTLAEPPRHSYHILPSKVDRGRMGWWYRFWWRVLLGTEIEKNR